MQLKNVSRLGSLSRLAKPLCAALLVLGVAACSGKKDDTVYPDDFYRSTGADPYDETPGSILGKDGLTIFGDDEADTPEGGRIGLGVNGYLWRAALDTLSFMPLASADPFGGVIITEWYSPPEAAQERFKVNVYILGRDLRADGVRASVFRQEINGTGTWVDSVVEEGTSVKLEDSILTRARQLRIAAVQ